MTRSSGVARVRSNGGGTRVYGTKSPGSESSNLNISEHPGWAHAIPESRPDIENSSRLWNGWSCYAFMDVEKNTLYLAISSSATSSNVSRSLIRWPRCISFSTIFVASVLADSRMIVDYGSPRRWSSPRTPWNFSGRFPRGRCSIIQRPTSTLDSTVSPRDIGGHCGFLSLNLGFFS